jgi:ZIP family zinc transporter
MPGLTPAPAMEARVDRVAAGHTGRHILAMWAALTAGSGIVAGVGFGLADSVPDNGLYASAFAAGAVLVMLADSMMPEAFRHGGPTVGLLTVLGYLIAATLSVAQ